MPNYRLISADSHVSEPPDLWVTRVDKKYRERAPRLAVDLPGKEGAYFLYEGYAPHPIGIGIGAGKSPEELKEFLTKATYADARGPAAGTRPSGSRTQHLWILAMGSLVVHLFPERLILVRSHGSPTPWYWYSFTIVDS